MTRFRLFPSVVPVIPKRRNNPFYRPELGLGCCYSRPYVNRAGITSTLRWEKQAAVIPKARSAEPLALWAHVARGATFNPKRYTHRRTASAKLLSSSPHQPSSRFNSPNPRNPSTRKNERHPSPPRPHFPHDHHDPHFGKEPDQVTAQPQQRQTDSNFTRWTLRNALRMALAGLSMRINRFTPDDAAERAARIAPRPPPLFGSPMGVFSPLQFPFQSSPSYEFTK